MKGERRTSTEIPFVRCPDNVVLDVLTEETHGSLGCYVSLAAPRGPPTPVNCIIMISKHGSVAGGRATGPTGFMKNAFHERILSTRRAGRRRHLVDHSNRSAEEKTDRQIVSIQVPPCSCPHSAWPSCGGRLVLLFAVARLLFESWRKVPQGLVPLGLLELGERLMCNLGRFELMGSLIGEFRGFCVIIVIPE